MTAEPYCPEPEDRCNAQESWRDEDPDAEDHGLDPWDYDLANLWDNRDKTLCPPEQEIEF